jgi:hypothetical protein
MAQRTVHYVFGLRLAEACGIADVPRFLLGSLLRDAIGSKEERNLTHFAFHGADGSRYYQFDLFRRDFVDQMSDPFYIGYYMHLVEDSFYRAFCHRDYQFYFIKDEAVRALHRDYHLLNPWIVKRYALVNRLTLPSDFSDEPLARIADFDLRKLREDFAQDFIEQPVGNFTYLCPSMIETFIERYLPQAETELRAVLEGQEFLRAADFAWRKTDE